MKCIVFAPFFLMTFMGYGACFQPNDGMNLWRMTAELGSCLDVIGDEILCSVGMVYQLKQTDFTGVVFINNPGYYKLCESVTASGTVVINSNDVILDLGRYVLDGVSCVISPNLKNTIIRNGTIRNVPFFINMSSGNQNVLIENLVLDTIIPNIPSYGIRVSSGGVQGLTIRNVAFYSSAVTSLVLGGTEDAPLSNIVLNNLQFISTNQSLPSNVFDSTLRLINCDYVQMKDISITNPREGIDALSLSLSEN